MSTLPEHWCIEATEENFAELYPWWRANASESFKVFAIGFTLMSSHPDGSCHFSNCEERCVRSYPNYQPITIEQFRQITNPKPMNTLPTKWYIGVTEENQEELNRWRKKVATEYRDHTVRVGHTLLSMHSCDGSYYYTGDTRVVRSYDEYKDYQEITLEQFRQIINTKPMSKSIQISRKLLNVYYEAATPPQREYIINHFKVDGTTTDEAIRGLHELACEEWKLKIRANHPECFPKDSKYFDFAKRGGRVRGIVSDKVADSLGLKHDFIQVRNNDENPETHYRSFYLTPEYNWELKQDGTSSSGGPIMVLIPTKK
jgi:hypothetical protein